MSTTRATHTTQHALLSALLSTSLVLLIIKPNDINGNPVIASNSLSEGSETNAQLIAKCCSIGKTSAQTNPRFACKSSARNALLSAGDIKLSTIDLALKSDSTFADQCEMTFESCCLAQHRTRNCDSGRQLAKSGSACMDVELSKEATLATESFNDCCMACSLGMLAARTKPSLLQTNNNNNYSSSLETNADNSRSSSSNIGQVSRNSRCKLSSSLQNSFAGLLYERTYVECCEESLPRAPLSSLVDTNAPIDCRQPNPCSQKCVPAALQLTADSLTASGAVDKCDCFAGYKLSSDNFNCIDIDECQLNTHSCDRQSEVCDNTVGGYKCLARHKQFANSATTNEPKKDSLPFFLTILH